MPARPSNLGGEEVLNVVNQSVREIQIRIDNLAKVLPIHRIVAASATLNFGSIPANSSVDRVLQMAGAKQTGSASASPQLPVGAHLSWSASITGNEQVTVRVTNPTNAAIVANVVKWNSHVVQ
jgi:hypothetical protein